MEPIEKTFESIYDKLYRMETISDASHEELKNMFYLGFSVCFELFCKKLLMEPELKRLHKINALSIELNRFLKKIEVVLNEQEDKERYYK